MDKSQFIIKEIYSNLKNLEKGDVSEPVIKGNTLTLFKLVDKRNIKSKNLDKEQLKKNLIDLKKLNYSECTLIAIYQNLKIQV